MCVWLEGKREREKRREETKKEKERVRARVFGLARCSRGLYECVHSPKNLQLPSFH